MLDIGGLTFWQTIRVKLAMALAPKGIKLLPISEELDRYCGDVLTMASAQIQRERTEKLQLERLKREIERTCDKVRRQTTNIRVVK